MSNLSAAELFGVKGMVFVITGGGTGIGAMMAKALDVNGARKVYIIGRRKDMLEAVAKEAVNGSIIPVQGDITSKDSLSTIAARIASEVGFVNVVLANHGTTGPTLNTLPKNPIPSLSEFQRYLWETSTEDFTKTYDVNSTGVFYTLLAFLSLLDAGNKSAKSPTDASVQTSQFIVTTSIAGSSRGLPSQGFAYSASKAAAIHQVKQLSSSLVPYDIRVNSISPGVYPSDMSTAFLAREEISKSVIPVGRAGTAEDMAGATLFLCSRAGAYCNGNIIISDGGRLAVIPGTY